MNEANNKQIAGDHYKSKSQHWDWVVELGLDYLPAQITKYVTRWRKKNGVEDLEKALHYTEKMLEIETKKLKEKSHKTTVFCIENNLSLFEAEIVSAIAVHNIRRLEPILDVKKMLEDMLASQKNGV